MGDATKESGWGAGNANESYMAPDHKPSTVRGSYMRMESAGIEHGLNAMSEFDSEYPKFPTYNNARNPITGNVLGRPNPYQDDAYGVTEKGHKMTVC